MVQLTDNIWAYPIPEGSYTWDLVLVDGKQYFSGDDEKGECQFGLEPLPPGNWDYLFTTKEATEEDARKVVGSSQWFFPAKHTRYIDYNYPYSTDNKQEWSIGFGTAQEALQSLILSKGCDVNRNYCIIQKI